MCPSCTHWPILPLAGSWRGFPRVRNFSLLGKSLTFSRPLLRGRHSLLCSSHFLSCGPPGLFGCTLKAQRSGSPYSTPRPSLSSYCPEEEVAPRLCLPPPSHPVDTQGAEGSLQFWNLVLRSDWFCVLAAGLLPRTKVRVASPAAAAAAKSLQSCPTLRDPIDGSPPGPRCLLSLPFGPGSLSRSPWILRSPNVLWPWGWTTVAFLLWLLILSESTSGHAWTHTSFQATDFFICVLTYPCNQPVSPTLIPGPGPFPALFHPPPVAPPDWASSSDVDKSSVKGILRGWNNQAQRVCLNGLLCELQTGIDGGWTVFIFVTWVLCAFTG